MIMKNEELKVHTTHDFWPAEIDLSVLEKENHNNVLEWLQEMMIPFLKTSYYFWQISYTDAEKKKKETML